MRATPRMQRFGAAILCAWSAACDSSGNATTAGDEEAAIRASTDSLVEHRDSAGVEIVAYKGAIQDLPVRFRIAATPSVDLGGPRDNPAAELRTGYVEQQAIRLADGRFAVRDLDVIQLFAADGKYLSSIGRRGEGPGEFTYLRGLCVGSGDTLIAFEDRPVAAVFDPSGKLVRTFTPPAPSATWAGCGVDRSLIARSEPVGDPNSGPYSNATLSLVTSEGEVLGTYPDVPAGSMVTHAPSLPSVIASTDRVIVGDGRSAEVRTFAWNGSSSRIVRWNSPGAPISDELLATVAGAMIPTNAPDREKRVHDGVIRARAQGPATFPAYLALRADDSGRLWVQDYALGRGLYGAYPPAWTVFDSSGRPLGRVELPKLSNAAAREELMGVGTDEVLLRWVDDEGFVHLSYHRLEPVP